MNAVTMTVIMVVTTVVMMVTTVVTAVVMMMVMTVDTVEVMVDTVVAMVMAAVVVAVDALAQILPLTHHSAPSAPDRITPDTHSKLIFTTFIIYIVYIKIQTATMGPDLYVKILTPQILKFTLNAANPFTLSRVRRSRGVILMVLVLIN